MRDKKKLKEVKMKTKKIPFDFEKFKSGMIISIARSMNIFELAETLKDTANKMQELMKRFEDEE
jgi:hypothetical protein